MATKKTTPAAATEVEASVAEAPAEAEAPKTDLVEVTAKKAFLDPTGWVQPGQRVDVTPSRKADLARNGLIEGSEAEKGADPAEAKDTTRKLNVTGAADDEQKDDA